ncbi:Pyranose 2-oxidase [Talaromyces islandicus]|uniref:Pyranose 2-oxidase n=1 Tax=Talaromyces islandicus TaxID=28573 RepID=A0A0U1M3Q5_TALIS|nr:Pyranose 2-oxidase [Talaromyces islandicus]
MVLPEVPCDVLVIGSGPIGATYAKEILEPKKGALPTSPKIIMVESGAQESKIPGDHKKNAVTFQKDIDAFVHIIKGSLHVSSVPTRVDPNLTLPPVSWSPRGKQNFNGQNQEQDIYSNLDANAVSRNVGGMSTHWTCATPRQLEGVEGTDIFDRTTWNKLYARAEELISTRKDVLNSSIRQRLVLEILRDAFPDRNVGPLPLAAKKVEGKNLITWSSSSTVLGDLLSGNPAKLDLRDQHICEKLEFETVQGVTKVKYAIVKDLAKPRSPRDPHDRIKIKPKYVVIAGGPILTPQLLYNSGFRPEFDDPDEGEPPEKPFLSLPALGRNLIEQTMCFCQIVLKDKWVRELQTRYWGEECEAHRKKFDKDADPLRIPFDDLDPQVTLPVTAQTPWHTQIHRDAFSYGAVPPAIDKRTIVDLRYFGRVQPRWRNRVKFSKKLTDAFGLPQPTFDVKLSKEDRNVTHKMMEDMEAVAGKMGGYLPGSEPQFLAPGLALHVCGTTVAQRRDPNKSDADQKNESCCDETSKIWGVENLYVGGLNVIPGSNASNPTLTAMCFAIKGAEAIRKKLNPTKGLYEAEDDSQDDVLASDSE